MLSVTEHSHWNPIKVIGEMRQEPMLRNISSRDTGI
jgi:hypothetical protein